MITCAPWCFVALLQEGIDKFFEAAQAATAAMEEATPLLEEATQLTKEITPLLQVRAAKGAACLQFACAHQHPALARTCRTISSSFVGAFLGSRWVSQHCECRGKVEAHWVSELRVV